MQYTKQYGMNQISRQEFQKLFRQYVINKKF